MNGNIDSQNPKVKRIVFNVSETCFFKCQMCSFWKNKKKDNVININIWKKVFKDLKQITNKNAVVSFTGGEPLASPIIFKVLSFSTKNGFITNLNTNGWLVNKKNIKRLYESGIKRITFSVDGSNSETHDKIRGVKGSFNKILTSVSSIKEYYKKQKSDIIITFVCVVSNLNYENLVNLVKLVQKSKYNLRIWLQSLSSPFYENDIVNEKIEHGKKNVYWYKHPKYNHLWPNDKLKIVEFYSELISMKKQGYKIINSIDHLKMQCCYFLNPHSRIKDTICNVFSDLKIDMTRGYAFICLTNYSEVSLGNITKDSIDKLWKSNKARQYDK